MGGSTKICVVHATTAHAANDGRIFGREVRTLSAADYVAFVVAPGDRALHSSHLPIPPRSSRLARAVLGSVDVFRVVRSLRPDIIHAHDPELLPVLALLRVTGIRCIYDAHEDLSEQIKSKPWLPVRSRQLISGLGWILIRFAARVSHQVIAATPKVAQAFASRRTTVVRNLVRVDEYDDPKVDISPTVRRVVYVGGLVIERGALDMIRAMDLIPSETDVTLTLAGPLGTGSLLQQMHAEPGWERCEYMGVLPPEGIAPLLRTADLGLCVLHDTRAYREAIPTKLFEYFAAGVPAIVSNFPEWREFTDQGRAAVECEPGSPAAIAAIILALSDQIERRRELVRNGRRLVRERFDWSIDARRLLSAYATVTAQAPGRFFGKGKQ